MSSGFISASELAEQRRIRQEEWERVRTANEPLARPEEPYDSRSLYDRLQEQKNKKDAEYEEAHKLKNMIKGLDDDEVEFLDLVDRTKLEEERKKNIEEEKEMKDFKAAVASLQEKTLDERLKQELKRPKLAENFSSKKNSQPKLLAGVVIKRSEGRKLDDNTRGTKRKISDDAEDTAKLPCEGEQKKSLLEEGTSKRIGILPGLGSYEDSDSGADSDEETPEEKRPQTDTSESRTEVSSEREKS